MWLTQVRRDPEKVKSELGERPDPGGPLRHWKDYTLTLTQARTTRGF